MNRTVSSMVVAFAVIALPLAGCGETNDKVTYGQSGPGDSASPEDQKKAKMGGVAPGSKPAGAAKNYPKPGESTAPKRAYR